MDTWTPEDWRADYSEREAIARYDGHLPRREAQDVAWKAAILRWLTFHFNPEGTPDACVQCGTESTGTAELLILNTRSTAKLWVHFECWESMEADWIFKADLALHQMDITRPLTVGEAEKTGKEAAKPKG